MVLAVDGQTFQGWWVFLKPIALTRLWTRFGAIIPPRFHYTANQAIMGCLHVGRIVVVVQREEPQVHAIAGAQEMLALEEPASSGPLGKPA